jgi:hypothetical protein
MRNNGTSSLSLASRLTREYISLKKPMLAMELLRNVIIIAVQEMQAVASGVWSSGDPVRLFYPHNLKPLKLRLRFHKPICPAMH